MGPGDYTKGSTPISNCFFAWREWRGGFEHQDSGFLPETECIKLFSSLPLYVFAVSESLRNSRWNCAQSPGSLPWQSGAVSLHVPQSCVLASDTPRILVLWRWLHCSRLYHVLCTSLHILTSLQASGPGWLGSWEVLWDSPWRKAGKLRNIALLSRISNVWCWRFERPVEPLFESMGCPIEDIFEKWY